MDDFESVNASFFDSPDEQEEVVGAAAIEMAGIQELAEEYARLDAERDRLEKELTDVQSKINRIDEAMVKAFENAGAEKMRLTPGLFSKLNIESFSMVPDKEEAAEKWIVSHGGAWMIKPSIHHKRLTSFMIRMRDEENQEIPDCFKLNTVTRIRFTPKKVKE